MSESIKIPAELARLLKSAGVKTLAININDVPDHLKEEFKSGKLTAAGEAYLEEMERKAMDDHARQIDKKLENGVGQMCLLIDMLMTFTNNLSGPFHDEVGKPVITKLYNKCAEVCRTYNTLELGEAEKNGKH